MLCLSPSADRKQPRIVDEHSLDVTLNHMRTKPEPEGRKSSVLSGMSSCRVVACSRLLSSFLFRSTTCPSSPINNFKF